MFFVVVVVVLRYICLPFFAFYYNFLGVLRIRFMCGIVCNVCIKALTNAPRFLPSHTISSGLFWLVLYVSCVIVHCCSRFFFLSPYFVVVAAVDVALPLSTVQSENALRSDCFIYLCNIHFGSVHQWHNEDCTHTDRHTHTHNHHHHRHINNFEHDSESMFLCELSVQFNFFPFHFSHSLPFFGFRCKCFARCVTPHHSSIAIRQSFWTFRWYINYAHLL